MSPPADTVPPGAALDGTPSLHVRRMGRADGGALPVVMLHGAVSGSLASWWMTCAPRVARAHPVVLYDLRGHGLSERPATGYRLRDHLDDLARVTAHLDAFALVGHSLGGWISVEAARAWPDRVAALVGVDVPLGGIRPELSLDEPDPVGAPGARRRRRHPIRLSHTSFRADLEAETQVDARSLAGVRCPTLMTFGRHSPFLAGAEIATAALGAPAVRVFDGGHALHLDATDQLSTAIVEFLSPTTAPTDEASRG